MTITEITVGLVATSCYILSLEDRDDCVIIDPGGEADRIRKAAGEKRIAALLLTHGHFDHIGAVGDLMADGVRLLVHEKDAPMLSDPSLNASLSLLRRPRTAPAPTDTFRDGDGGSLGRQLPLFIAVSLVSLGASTLVVWLLTRWGVNKYVAKVLSMAISTTINYLGIKTLVFRIYNNKEDQRDE